MTDLEVCPGLETRLDRLLDGRLALRQPVQGHRAGTDAVLLAAAVGLRTGVLVDAGAGVGTAGLMAALCHPDLTVHLVERDPQMLALAHGNIAENALTARVDALGCDVTRAASRRLAGLRDGEADCVIANPPWHVEGTVRASPIPVRADAHVFAADALAHWLRALAALVRPAGHMVIIHRPDALADLIAASARRFGSLTILPVHAQAHEPARRILLSGIRGSRGPLRLLPALVLHEPDGRFTACAQALHRGTASLTMMAPTKTAGPSGPAALTICD